MARYDNFSIVGQANQSLVEHPVHGARKSNAVANVIWTVCFYWPDMSGFDFGPAPSIDQFQACNSKRLS